MRRLMEQRDNDSSSKLDHQDSSFHSTTKWTSANSSTTQNILRNQAVLLPPLPQRRQSTSSPTHHNVATVLLRRQTKLVTNQKNRSYMEEGITTDIYNLCEQSSQLSLLPKLLGDVAVGAGVTFCVAPFISVVDKAIVEMTAGSHTILQSVMESGTKIVSNPFQFFKSPMFLYMWSVYAATYSTVNCLKTIVEDERTQQSVSMTSNTSYTAPTTSTSMINTVNSGTKQLFNTSNKNNQFDNQESKFSSPRIKTTDARTSDTDTAGTTTTTSAGIIFFGTTLVNAGTSLWKDRAFARMFGTGTAFKQVPLMSYGLWLSRDCMVIGSSFVLPDLVTNKLLYVMDDHHHAEDNASLDHRKHDRVQRISQLVCPIVTQFIAGPLHLVGLDCYNRPLKELTTTREVVMERMRLLVSKYWGVVAARVARIAPAYSIGGVGNTYFRDMWRSHLVHLECERARRMKRLEAAASATRPTTTTTATASATPA